MGWFDRPKHYDRSRILDEAAHARAKKRRKKAIALYRRVLAVERHNAELHAKIAPLLSMLNRVPISQIMPSQSSFHACCLSNPCPDPCSEMTAQEQAITRT